MKTSLQVLYLCVIPNLRYLSKCFAEIYRTQYGNTILVYLRGTPDSLSMRVFETRTATRSELFSLLLALTQPHLHC